MYYSENIHILVDSETKNIVEQQVTKLKEDGVITKMAQVVYNEARGIKDTSHKAAIIWCIFNRMDSTEFPNSWDKIIVYGQVAYWSGTPIIDEFVELAEDVAARYYLEKMGCADVGRVLPSNYCFYGGNNKQTENYFRTEYHLNSSTQNFWNWSLVSPYSN